MTVVQLHLDDVRAVMGLVREVCDRWDDPRAWREHLLSGACKLLSGNVGTIIAPSIPKEGEFGGMRVIAAVGLNDSMRKALLEPALQSMENREIAQVAESSLPGVTTLFSDFARQGWATAARNQLCDPAEYHASIGYTQFRKHADSDDFVLSVRTVDEPNRVEVLDIDRPHGAPPFDERDVAILKLLHDEIAPLVGVRLATEEHFSREGLSRRLRETLSLLLEGHGEKQIAAKLALSPLTVHGYISNLFRHFQVSSRAQLMAYFVARQPAVRSD